VEFVEEEPALSTGMAVFYYYYYTQEEEKAMLWSKRSKKL